MLNRIRIRMPAMALLIAALGITLGMAPIAVSARADWKISSRALPPPTETPPVRTAAGDATNPYYSVETITLSDGRQLEQARINGPAKPPPGYERERTPVATSALNQPGVASSLPVPAYGWVFGCSAVSASMIGAYLDQNGFPNIYTGPTGGGVMPMDDSVWPTWTDGYGDNYSGNPLVASRAGLDGRTTRGSIDDYWIGYQSTASDPYITGGWTQHIWGDSFGDYMKTSQSAYGNVDGSTSFAWWKDGLPLTCADMAINGVASRDGSFGRKLFYEARGYSVAECFNQQTDNIVAGGFSFADYKAQIDAKHPVLLSLEGHSVVGIGYIDPSTVYIYDTWDYQPHEMAWGGSYSGMMLRAVSIVNPDSATNPLPAITGLNPSSATPSGSAFTLTVNGTNFVNGSVVRWNGSDRTTTFVSGSQLTAVITAADIAAAGTANVTAFNPEPGGGTSNAVSFVVGNPVPAITGITPSSAKPGGAAFTLTVNGLNFVPDSLVRWNGSDRPTTYGSGTQLTAAITAADIATAGTARVTVFSPEPGGGTSNAVSFVAGVDQKVYLPLVLKGLPIPTLNAIGNLDGDGNYTVSWSASAGATGYLLQEDDDAGFPSPETRYSGSGTSWNVTGKAPGVYYYRVRAENAQGASGWSNIQSVIVGHLLPARLSPVADTTVLEGVPTFNVGSTSDMWVGYEHCTDVPNGIVRSLIRFDTSIIPSGTPVASAKLYVFLESSCDIGSRTHMMTSHRVTNDWSEMGATWDNQPGYDGEYGSTAITTLNWGWYSIDITGLVQGWVNGSFPNYGVMLRANESSGNDSARLGFTTRNLPDASYHPYVSLTYDGASVSNVKLPSAEPATPSACGNTIRQQLRTGTQDATCVFCAAQSCGEK